MSISVLGIGSPFGDDRAGWAVIEKLTCTSDVFLACCDRPGIRILDMMQGASEVILIDAVKTGAPIGTCHHFYQEEIEQIYGSVSTHEIGIGYALKLGRELTLLPEKISLYGIEIGEVCPGSDLSFPVKQAVIQTCSLIASQLPIRQ